MKIFLSLNLLLLLASGFFIISCLPDAQLEELQEQKEAVPTGSYTGEIKTMPDGTKYIIDPDKFISGGPGKGGIGIDKGIPALVDPEFISAEDAIYLPKDELVLGIIWKGESRAYPYRILVWHEIANDKIQGDPVLVTYCPLCFTGVAFKSEIEEKRELFGVSGKLYNSQLVMYDKTTESYWPQSLGMAVAGARTGKKVEKIPVDVAIWGDWKKAHPETKVLSEQTGFTRSYGTNPYGKKGDFSDIGFRIGVDETDQRLPAQTIVYGVGLGGNFTAYPDSTVREEKIINDNLGGDSLVIFYDKAIGGPKIFKSEVDGMRLTFKKENNDFTDEQTGTVWSTDGIALAGKLEGAKLERIVHEPTFWFAWAAFHQETELYQ